MAEQNMIDDVRNAKAWLDGETPTFQELWRKLHTVEREYLERTGPYALVPTQRPSSVQQVIDQASDEPGRELLKDARPA